MHVHPLAGRSPPGSFTPVRLFRRTLPGGFSCPVVRIFQGPRLHPMNAKVFIPLMVRRRSLSPCSLFLSQRPFSPGVLFCSGPAETLPRVPPPSSKPPYVFFFDSVASTHWPFPPHTGASFFFFKPDIKFSSSQVLVRAITPTVCSFFLLHGCQPRWSVITKLPDVSDFLLQTNWILSSFSGEPSCHCRACSPVFLIYENIPEDHPFSSSPSGWGSHQKDGQNF